jgi:RHS repeat-associated protein
VSSGVLTQTLSLAAFGNNTNDTAQFGNDTNLLKRQYAQMTLDNQDDSLTVEVTYRRHRLVPTEWSTNVPFWDCFLGIAEQLRVVTQRPMRKGDLAALCLNVGRVTPQMLAVHAEEIWRGEYARQQTNSAPPVEDFQGASAYLMGMEYYQKESRFAADNLAWHKLQMASRYAFGLSALGAQRDGSGHLPDGEVRFDKPRVDMAFQEAALLANGTLRPDLGQDNQIAEKDYAWLSVAAGSAYEHQILNSYYGQSNAVSTMRLLQLTTNNPSGVLELTHNNYPSYGETTYAGKKLKNHDTNLWSQVTAAFTRSDGLSNYSQVFITPGPITNESRAFAGMAALVMQIDSAGAFIGPTIMNGGFGDPTIQYMVEVKAGLRYTADGYVLSPMTPNPNYQQFSDLINLRAPPVYSPQVPVVTTPTQDRMFDMASMFLDLDRAFAPFDLHKSMTDWGLFDEPNYRKGRGTTIADPVNIMTGEFYVDAADLTLPGPLPLAIRRNYSSHNLAHNEFGYGWQMNYEPYLSVSRGETNIYAAEPDGSVIAYRRQDTNFDLWLPQPEQNPTLNNHSTDGVGGLANLFNSKLIRTNDASHTNFVLRLPDGTTRVYGFRSYPINVGAERVERVRPYLDEWLDRNSNRYTFSYGTNELEPDYGQLRRVQSSGGAFLGFYYDTFGQIVEAYTGDGRRLYYEYDTFGDLIRVVLPDASEINYQYRQQSFVKTVTNTNPYAVITVTNLESTHLLTREFKPDGRTLRNEYDEKRRVTNQWSTAGPDLRLVRTAKFAYTNNYDLQAPTNLLEGVTAVYDYTNRSTFYYYTNSLIRVVTDPLGYSFYQKWYQDDTTNGGYRRSLKQSTDVRGLETTYLYDERGNVTNRTLKGNLTGGDSTNETVTTAYAYNSKNLVTNWVDAAGNTHAYAYTNYLRLSEVLLPLNGTGADAITNTFEYYSVTNDLDTNLYSAGLRRRATRAANSPDAAVVEWLYEYRGFPTQEVRYTGGSYPDVTNYFRYNGRGERIEQTDAAGRTTRFDCDAMGRPIWKEVFDESGKSLAGEYSYYNENGELTWSDGPRYGPEDYVWRDYDGSGRLTQEIHWRSRVNWDRTGVEADEGDDLYATSFSAYDPAGNVTWRMDPRGHYSTMEYDARNRLVASRSYDGTTGTPLARNGFAYEPGGLVAFQTNALGALTTNAYTWTEQLKARKNPDASTEGWRYYLDGRESTNILASGAYWVTTYDDAHRKVTRTLYNAGITASETKEFDRRGNLIKLTDVDGYVFTNAYDGLDRIKVAAGPPTVAGVSTQQVTTTLYDGAGVVRQVVNALGERTVTTFDALGRPTSVSVGNAANALVRKTVTLYTPDHHGVTVVDGTTGAITNTSYTDTFNKPVLTQKFSSTGAMETTAMAYDVAENQAAIAVGPLDDPFELTFYEYDALNRLVIRVRNEVEITFYGYDAAGDLTNRTMPGGLVWSGTYANDGRILSERLNGSSRVFTYQYYTSGPSIGRLQTVVDPRQVTTTYSYDTLFRLTNQTTSGAQTNVATSFEYNKRGQRTWVGQAASGQPSTGVQRAFDGYGQILSEQVYLDGTLARESSQQWDAAGRRANLSVPGAISIGYQHQADGHMTHVSVGTQVHSFAYGDHGLLKQRANLWRTRTVLQRDGAGRPTLLTNTLAGGSAMQEALGWDGDGRLDSYVATRPGVTDTRDFGYDYWLGGRLTNEDLALVPGGSVSSLRHDYDFGEPGGLGILTLSSNSASLWQVPAGGTDSLGRVWKEREDVARRAASGDAVGALKVQLSVDGRDQRNVLYTPASSNGYWRAELQLHSRNGGSNHTVLGTAYHPSGLFTNWATNTYSVDVWDKQTNRYDLTGNVTVRELWTQTNALVRVQTLIWDGLGRLIQVTERDSTNDGYNWSALYDGLGRRLRTTYTPVQSGIPNAVSGIQIDSYFDPQVEFLEVGVAVNGQRTWKVYGPDVGGRYGGAQGIGGLEATIRESDGLATGILNDYFGHALATYVTNWNWSPTRYAGYGPVPGFPAPQLSLNLPVAESVGWRGYRFDPSGLIWMGARYYDPVSGRFLSPDPLGHEGSLGLYSYAGGDPINSLDPTGECSNSAQDMRNMALSAYLDPDLPLLDFLKREGLAASNPTGVADWLLSRVNESGLIPLNADDFARRDWRPVTGADFMFAPRSSGWNDLSHAEQVSRVLDWTPFLNVAKSTFQTTLGIDVITGQEVSRTENAAMSALTLLPIGGVTRPATFGVRAELAFAERSLAAEAAPELVWNNGWRTLDGKFASPLGGGRAGAAAEQAVWDAVRQKPGWTVIEGRVSVRNAAGDLRVYDGAAVSPRGRVIGLEVKSGSATRNGAQSTFDAGVNTFNPAFGVGQSANIPAPVGRAILIGVS